MFYGTPQINDTNARTVACVFRDQEFIRLITCDLCDARNIIHDHRTGDRVCSDCGYVCGSIMLGEGCLDSFTCKSYKRIHHFSGMFTVQSSLPDNRHIHNQVSLFFQTERMALFACKEPAIPDDLFELIEDSYDRLSDGVEGQDIRQAFQANPYNRSLINQILDAVELPEALQIKYKSKKWKKTLFTKSRFKEKFGKLDFFFFP